MSENGNRMAKWGAISAITGLLLTAPFSIAVAFILTSSAEGDVVWLKARVQNLETELYEERARCEALEGRCLRQRIWTRPKRERPSNDRRNRKSTMRECSSS